MRATTCSAAPSSVDSACLPARTVRGSTCSTVHSSDNRSTHAEHHMTKADPSQTWRSDLLSYLERVHERTRRIVVLIPAADVEWAPRDGAFTLGGLVRHIAGMERWMNAENVSGRASRYPGHGPELADGLEAVIAYYDRLHAESRAI